MGESVDRLEVAVKSGAGRAGAGKFQNAGAFRRLGKGCSRIFMFRTTGGAPTLTK
ncbi:MAG: hypothetical protein JWL81_2333 [Verrucomicrobiales bacterium]|nr:hypothetical protein [Verrucomicrobiales bacterium]